MRAMYQFAPLYECEDPAEAFFKDRFSFQWGVEFMGYMYCQELAASSRCEGKMPLRSPANFYQQYKGHCLNNAYQV